MAIMRFVETSVFTAVPQRHLDDERYRQLQIALMLRPEQGDLTPLQVRALAKLVRETFK